MFQFIYLLNWSLLAGHLCMKSIYCLLSLRLARFFLTQQLIYKNKIEKNNVNLDIFVSDTNIARKVVSILNIKHFSWSVILR